jgi:hypothetical protein
MDPYAKAKAELAEIDSLISALQQRRGALRQFVELGATLYAEPRSQGGQVGLVGAATALGLRAAVNASEEEREALGLQASAGTRSTMKDRALAACAEHIRRYGPTHTRDLVAVVEAAGVQLGGVDKASALSVMLSKAVEFDSNRRFGWSLAETKEKGPEGVSAPTEPVV